MNNITKVLHVQKPNIYFVAVPSLSSFFAKSCVCFTSLFFLLHSTVPFNSLIIALKSRRMRWAGHVASMGEGRDVHRVLVGKPEGKRSLGRPRRRWEDNIKMDLQEVGGGCGDWMELAQDRERRRALVSTVRNLRVPKMRGIS